MAGVERGREDTEHVRRILEKTPNAGRAHPREVQPVRHGNRTLQQLWTEPTEHPETRRLRKKDARAILEWLGQPRADKGELYASIELWLAAVRWRAPYMQRALQQGVNMHVATAAALFNASSRGRRSLRSKIRRRITSVLPA